MNVEGLAVVPATASLLARGGDPVRRRVAEAVAALPAVETVVLLTGGEEAMLPDGHRISIDVPGDGTTAAEVTVDRDLLGAVATNTSTPRLRADELDGPPAVLAALVASSRPDVAFLPLCVARGAAGTSLGAVAAGLLSAIETTDRRVAIVADGQLGQLGPLGQLGQLERDGDAGGAVGDRSTAWASEVSDALRRNDPDALAQLGPREASERGAHGWAPLAVLAQVGRARQLGVRELHLATSDGVARLIAH